MSLFEFISLYFIYQLFQELRDIRNPLWRYDKIHRNIGRHLDRAEELRAKCEEELDNFHRRGETKQ